MKVAVLGSSGYAGLVLLRILYRHSGVSDIVPVSTSRTGQDVWTMDPGLPPEVSQKMPSTQGRLVSIEEAARLGPEVVFAALPPLQSANACAAFFDRTVLIDLSADFRHKNHQAFEKAYGVPPPRRDLLEHSVYGLPEWYREQIARTDIIANPGCYPTATLLPILPLAKERLLEGQLIINAISGISGAGRKTEANYLFCERSENAGAYNPGKRHRHAAEIEEQIANVDTSLDLLFTPHLAPLKRGIAVTTVVRLTSKISQSAIDEIYHRYYDPCPFVVLCEDRIPQTRDVWGSNRCDIGWHIEGQSILLFSAIDNLVKGAAGQAVQNMNIRMQLNETAGLSACGEL